MARAFEIMNKQVFSVHWEDTVEDVVKIFKEHRISGLPVVDNENKVVGIVSDRDLLQYSQKLDFIPLLDFSAWVSPYASPLETDSYKRSSEAFLKTKVTDVMSEEVISARENDSWHQAANLMKESGINRIPVVDDEGKLKGIITRDDLLCYIAEKGE